ncbi:MAG: response regulator [Sphaerochaetaceae bacterium]|nr:response regulator [Sphaerochaetaceae bacterium]
MKNIAIVDDEQEILDMLKRFLSRREEFKIDTFLNPEAALSSLTNGKYDLIITDIMMPQMDGVELLKKIKQNNPSQKVIMMTAFSTEHRLIECDNSGADDYITKPFISLRDVENKVLDIFGH